MHSYRGRGGPRQNTPASVQCQKCLKRGHYSYECKAALQERPYKARPSRTQQLLNPRLAPKLTNDAFNDETRKKGIADEELAKKEAERARKRELDAEDGPADREPEYKRRRSISAESVASISTRSSQSPPPRRRASPSPRRGGRDLSPPDQQSVRSRSYDSVSGNSQRRSPSPERSYRPRDVERRSPVRRSLSPDIGYQARDDRRHRSPYSNEPRARRAPREDSLERDQSPPRHRRHSPDSKVGGRSKPHQRYGSRSPVRTKLSNRGWTDEGVNGRYRDRNDDEDRGAPSKGQEHRRGPPRQPEPPRERSLSPFSKRLALTQAMNMDR